MSFTKYNGSGVSGLQNLGNTCYINSVLQVLNYTYELHEIIEDKINKNNVNKEKVEAIILKEWWDLKTIMFNNNGIVSPNKFIHFLKDVANKKKIDTFSGHDQNDLTELFHFTINCFHSSISRPTQISLSGYPKTNKDKLAEACFKLLKELYKKEYSEIMTLFQGIYVSLLYSADKKNIKSVKPEVFLSLDLSVSDTTRNLYDCLNGFIDPELMDGDNAWYNEETRKKENVYKNMSFWSFPDVLCVCLKRFNICGTKKNNISIEYPVTGLDLSKYSIGYNSHKYVYDLYAVCNHVGGMSYGHYYVYVKNSENKWMLFNDDSVSVIDDLEKLFSPHAYCLFYRIRAATMS